MNMKTSRTSKTLSSRSKLRLHQIAEVHACNPVQCLTCLGAFSYPTYSSLSTILICFTGHNPLTLMCWSPRVDHPTSEIVLHYPSLEITLHALYPSRLECHCARGNGSVLLWLSPVRSLMCLFSSSKFNIPHTKPNNSVYIVTPHPHIVPCRPSVNIRRNTIWKQPATALSLPSSSRYRYSFSTVIFRCLMHLDVSRLLSSRYG
jgi:hypothetical protein